MKYCFEVKGEVYDCDHYQCRVGAKDHNGASGMKYCHVVESDVYSCDHYDCNKD